MKRFRKWICLLLAAVLVCQTCGVALAESVLDETVSENTTVKTDVEEKDADALQPNVNSEDISGENLQQETDREDLYNENEQSEDVSDAEDANLANETEEIMADEEELFDETETSKVPGSQMRIHAIYLKEEYGDAVLVESEGEYLLMDMGTKDSYSTVKEYLDKVGVKKLSLYYSHWHGDHTGGMGETEGFASLAKDFDVQAIYLPDPSVTDVDRSWYYGKIKQRYTSSCGRNVDDITTYLKNGSSFSFGDVNVSIIGPIDISKLTKDNVEKADSSYINNCSLVAKLTCGKTTYLTCGDCSEEEENLLVKKYGNSLKADIYKMSHHGYPTGNREAFMAKVKPTYSFALNSGDAAGLKTNSSGRSYRVTFSSIENCSEYGLCYMVGEEKDSLVIDVDDNNVSLYRASNLSEKFAGWVKVYGADGYYEKYDYYYLGADGKPLTGIQKIDGKSYNFGNGGCLKKGYYKVSDSKAEYIPWVNETDEAGNTGIRYYDEETGEMVTGFYKVSGNTFYMDPETGFRQKAVVKVGDEFYYFKNTGELYTQAKWFTLENGQKGYVQKTGKIKTGMQTIAGKKCYISPETGLLITGKSNKITEINGKYYVIDSWGKILTNGSVKIGSVTYKFDSSGKCTNPPTVSKTSIKSVSVATGKMTVKWKRNKKVKGYEIYVSTSKKSGYVKAKSISKNKTVKCTIKKPAGKYYVKMRSVKKVNGQVFYSKYSPVKTVTIK